MKNNLLKSVAAAATASALLFSTVTSFAAATATTVTTYKSGSKVGVTSTITGAPEGKMITYLASSGVNGAVNSESDIKYIGQKTVPAGGNVSFSYDIDGATVGKTVATVRYGSDDAATATNLNKDASNTVVYGDLTVKAYGCTVKPETATVGNGNPVNVTIESIQTGYELKEVWINGVKSTQDLSSSTYQVKYADNMEFVAICGAKTDITATTNVVAVMDYVDTNAKTVGIVCNKYAATANNDVTFGVVAVKRGNNDKYIMSGMNDNFYEAGATVAGTEESYYAVELCCADFNDLKLIPAYKDSNGVHQSEN